jgi:glycosyltransferase involved in cell wall biosynthesis
MEDQVSTPQPARLSACIIAFNEADRIAECVRSLACCDQVVVVDSHSTDGTREIATSLGARVVERDWSGYVAQKEFAVYLGRWIRHGTWYPDRAVRLFDRRRGRWVGHPAYALHEHVELDSAPGRLQHDLLHYPYRTFADHLRTIDQYTTIIAQGLHAHGRRATISDFSLRPLFAFIRFYWLKRGFLDGWRGLLLAYLHAHYVRMKYAKLFLLSQAPDAA